MASRILPGFKLIHKSGPLLLYNLPPPHSQFPVNQEQASTSALNRNGPAHVTVSCLGPLYMLVSRILMARSVLLPGVYPPCGPLPPLRCEQNLWLGCSITAVT